MGRTRVVRRRTGSVRGSYAGVRGAYAVRGFYPHGFFEGRFFVGFVEDFAVVEGQVKVFSFLDSDERKVFIQEGLSLLKAQPNTTRAPTPRLEGSETQSTKEPQEGESFAMDREVKGERTHKQHKAPTRLSRSGSRPLVRLGRLFWSLGVRFSLVTSVVGL